MGPRPSKHKSCQIIILVGTKKTAGFYLMGPRNTPSNNLSRFQSRLFYWNLDWDLAASHLLPGYSIGNRYSLTYWPLLFFWGTPPKKITRYLSEGCWEGVPKKIKGARFQSRLFYWNLDWKRDLLGGLRKKGRFLDSR